MEPGTDVHPSSPLEGWHGQTPERHHDFIDVKDFPNCWSNLDITVEVEAKEAAVLKLKAELDGRRFHTGDRHDA